MQPLLISPSGTEVSALTPLGLGLGGHGLSEANIQELVHRHPSCLPIAATDSAPYAWTGRSIDIQCLRSVRSPLEVPTIANVRTAHWPRRSFPMNRGCRQCGSPCAPFLQAFRDSRPTNQRLDGRDRCETWGGFRLGEDRKDAARSEARCASVVPGNRTALY
jgi:hypothetical protein